MLDAIAAYLAVMREPGPDEVRVRACVAVGPDGQWVAAGANDQPVDAFEAMGEFLSWPIQRRFIEANVPAWAPVPEATVEGEVTE